MTTTTNDTAEPSAESPAESTPEPMIFDTRGVYYFEGRVKCPMAGVGSRGDHDSNRLALDNADSRVTIDRAARRITVHNDVRYPDKTIVADLMFLADGATARGTRTPFGVHLKIFKTGDKFSIDLHRHLRNQDRLVGAELEQFEVVATDGRQRQVLLDDSIADKLIARPSLALRVIKAFMAMRNNLEGVAQDPARPGYRLADLTMGFGRSRLAWMMVRAQLASLTGDNAPLIERGEVAEMLRRGAWELKVTAFTERYVSDVIKRDVFLFGLDELPLLADVRERGLRKGETLTFRFEDGRGEIGLGDEFVEMPGAIDVARAYMEFHMLGGLLVEETERGAAARA